MEGRYFFLSTLYLTGPAYIAEAEEASVVKSRDADRVLTALPIV